MFSTAATAADGRGIIQVLGWGTGQSHVMLWLNAVPWLCMSAITAMSAIIAMVAIPSECCAVTTAALCPDPILTARAV
jgi:hypothetical protein